MNSAFYEFMNIGVLEKHALPISHYSTTPSLHHSITPLLQTFIAKRIIHVPALAYRPASRSSNTIPNPPLSFSRCFMGKGFKTSKNRNRKNPRQRASQEWGKRAIVNKYPTTSSMTTSEGSFFPNRFWVLSEDQTAITTASRSRTVYTLLRIPRLFNARTRGTAARVPMVPEANGESPLPNQVERTKASLSEKTDFLNISWMDKLSDRDFDIKSVLLHIK